MSEHEKIAAPPAPTYDALWHAVRRNPIIGETSDETLYSLGCAVSYLAQVHGELASAAMQMQGAGIRFPLEYSANQHRGLGLLLECVESALWFELEGRK